MRYTAFTPLIELAQPTSGLGRLIMGMAMITVGYVALTLMYYAVLARVSGLSGGAQILLEIQTSSTPQAMLKLLGSFSMMIAALWVPLRLIHRRSLLALFGPLWPTIQNFIRVTVAIAVIVGIVSLVPTPAQYTPVANLDPAIWRAFLPLSLIAVLVQITAEELLFRGYLQSQLAARFRHPAVWILLPSILFGMLHYDASGAGDNALMLVMTAGLFGIIAADLTARSGNLGAAMAIHFVTNVSGLLIYAPAQGLNGLALYTYPFSMDDSAAAAFWMPIDVMILLTSWLAARIVLKR